MTVDTESVRANGMFSAKETNRRIRELAEAEGRTKPVTIRFVDPATLPPSKVTTVPDTKTRLRGAADFQRMRDTKTERHDAGAKRALVIAYLDSEPGVPRRRSEIATAVPTCSATYLTQLLRELTDHGHINAAGITTARRYWRGQLETPDTVDAQTVAEVRAEIEHETPEPETPVGSPDWMRHQLENAIRETDYLTQRFIEQGREIARLQTLAAERAVLLRVVLATVSNTFMPGDLRKVIEASV